MALLAVGEEGVARADEAASVDFVPVALAAPLRVGVERLRPVHAQRRTAPAVRDQLRIGAVVVAQVDDDAPSRLRRHGQGRLAGDQRLPAGRLVGQMVLLAHGNALRVRRIQRLHVAHRAGEAVLLHHGGQHGGPHHVAGGIVNRQVRHGAGRTHDDRLPALALPAFEAPVELRGVDDDVRPDHRPLPVPDELVSAQHLRLPLDHARADQLDERLRLRAEDEARPEAHLRHGGHLAERPDARREDVFAGLQVQLIALEEPVLRVPAFRSAADAAAVQEEFVPLVRAHVDRGEGIARNAEAPAVGGDERRLTGARAAHPPARPHPPPGPDAEPPGALEERVLLDQHPHGDRLR